MCWVCKQIDTLIENWNEERELQELTSGDYHRGLAKGFLDCSRDLAEVITSLRAKGLCDKFPDHEEVLGIEEKSTIVDEILKSLKSPGIETDPG